MFKFLKRLRGEKPEAQPQVPQESALPVAETAVDSQPVVEAPPVAVEKPVEQVESGRVVAQNLEPVPNAPSRSEQVPLAEVELPKRSLGDGIRSLFSSSVDLDDLEDILIRADFGVDAALEITEDLKREANKVGASSDAELRLLLKDLLTKRLTRDDAALNLSSGDLPYVILVVGVNGAGKTTTIGKLSRWLKDGDWSVVLGAADTFRAAAVDQLATWEIGRAHV